MKESIFFASIRAFFVGLFAMAGITIGITLVIALIGSFESASSEPESNYTVEVIPNAEGVRKSLSDNDPLVLVLSIEGVIGTESLSMASVREQLVESREGKLKDRVKAVLLQINSPGGTVVDADGIYRALKSYKEQYKVPVYAYVDGLCASGGMYVAAAADKVFASDVSLIGSVGVLSPSFFNVSKTLDKIGVETLTLTAGKDKDMMNPLRPWQADEQKPIQQLIDYYYNLFVEIVASNRTGLTKEKLITVYGANVFNPVEAAKYGFIDASGLNYSDSLKQLVKQAGIENSYQVVRLKSSNWLSSIFSSSSDLLKGKITHRIHLSGEADPCLSRQFLYLYRPLH